MYYFYGKVNQGHMVCPLYRGGPYLGESIMGGATVNNVLHGNDLCLCIYNVGLEVCCAYMYLCTCY